MAGLQRFFDTDILVSFTGQRRAEVSGIADGMMGFSSSHFPSETHLLTLLGRGALRVWSDGSTGYQGFTRGIRLLARGVFPQ